MKTTLLWLVFGALVISNVVFVMLFLVDSGSNSTVADSKPLEASEVSEADSDVMKSEASAQASAEVVEERTKYKAKASKFALDLKPQYQVVIEKDGGADSERSTILRIGRKDADENGSISLNANDYVKIEGYPTDINGTRDQFVTNDTALQGNLADESSATIDGTPARKFSLSGVGDTIKYYFERDGITYHIEAYDVSSGDTRVLVDDVVRGFRFN